MWTPLPSNGDYLEGQGDLVGRFIMGIRGVSAWVIGATNLLSNVLLTLQIYNEG